MRSQRRLRRIRYRTVWSGISLHTQAVQQYRVLLPKPNQLRLAGDVSAVCSMWSIPVGMRTTAARAGCGS